MGGTKSLFRENREGLFPGLPSCAFYSDSQILIRVILNLWITLGTRDIVTFLSLLTHGQRCFCFINHFYFFYVYVASIIVLFVCFCVFLGQGNGLSGI